MSKKITFDDFRKCIFENCTISDKQMTFRSSKHSMYTINTHKRILNADDDKRIILDDGINTQAIGHHDPKKTRTPIGTSINEWVRKI